MKITDSQLYKYVPKAEKLWLSWLPTDEEIPEHIFSKRFERKMKRLIRNQRRTPRIRKIFLTAKRITAAVLVLTMLSFSGLYSQAVLWLFLCHYMRVLSGDSRLCCGIA